MRRFAQILDLVVRYWIGYVMICHRFGHRFAAPLYLDETITDSVPWAEFTCRICRTMRYEPLEV